MGLFAGRYHLVAPISSGGNGTVWQAWDHRQRRYVAAKLLRASDAGSLLRFVREQGLRIDHPHVVAPLGWAADDDQVLLTMTLVRGGNVAGLLADYGALPLPYVGALIDQLLDALTVVHSHRVVHRDVKPSNLLLDVTGRGTPSLRLADFGIAAVLGEPRLTQVTRVVGTPGYLPPEALDGAEPDFRHDIYAVGVVTAELLTGTRPDLRGVWDVPDPVARFIRIAAATDPADRYATAAEARTAWREALRDVAVGPIDADDPDAVEVFDQIGELPPGFGPDGPISSSAGAVTGSAPAASTARRTSSQPHGRHTGRAAVPPPRHRPQAGTSPASNPGGPQLSHPGPSGVRPQPEGPPQPAAHPARGSAGWAAAGTPSAGRTREPDHAATGSRRAILVGLLVTVLGAVLLAASVTALLAR